MLTRSRALRSIAMTVLALAIAASAATAASAARARTGKYKGKSSQSLTVKLTVKDKGKHVDFAIPYAKETDCTGNSTFVAPLVRQMRFAGAAGLVEYGAAVNDRIWTGASPVTATTTIAVERPFPLPLAVSL